MCRSDVQHSHLPWRSRRDRSIADTHRPHPRREYMSVGTVVVANQVGWRRGPRKRLGNLTGQPLGCRMPRHLEPKQLSPAVTWDQECKRNPCTGNRTVGSNPTLSAKTALKPADFRHSEKVTYKRTYKCVWSGRSGPRHSATSFLCGDQLTGRVLINSRCPHKLKL
jgi:hypothetical protein